MRFPTKAGILKYPFRLAQALTTARAKPTATMAVRDKGPAAEETASSSGTWHTALSLAMSVANIGLITAMLLVLDRRLAASLVPIAYLPAVIFAATQWGVWHAMLASVAGVAAADFFFFTPLYSFRVDDPEEAVDLLLFLIVALVSSNLAWRLRRETQRLRRREQEIQQLYEFSQRLAACFTVSDLIAAIQHYLSLALRQKVAFFVAMADGHHEPSEPVATPKIVRDNIASMIIRTGPPSRSMIDEVTREVWLLRSVSSETAVHGVIAINIGAGSHGSTESKTRRVEAVLEEVSLTLKRLDIGKAMEDARLHVQAQLLRDAFHGTLSHELCSPLAGIRGSASVLSSMPVVRGDVQANSLVEGISEEVAELESHIQNLLHATRVSAGGLSPRPEWADPRDVINAAIRRRARRLAAHKVTIAFADDLPLVHLDSGLIEEACGQVLDNAAKYSPSGSNISVGVWAEAGQVIFSVADQGVGITPDELQQLGRRSFRSERHQATVPGSGLGFWIASTFVRANGGTIVVSSYGQGTRVAISLPSSPTTPSELMAMDNE
jgi:two-component system sensor histidine kinase KdpD